MTVVYHSLLICFAIDEHLGYPHTRGFRNNVVMNIFTNVPWYHNSVGSTTKSGLLGHRVCVFTTLQDITILFPKGVVLHQLC